jgi:hypothetical protein
MAPTCDWGFDPSMVRKRDVGEIGCLLNEAPEDPRDRKAKGVHQPDEADLPVINNRKHASEVHTVDLFVVVLIVHFLSTLPFNRHLDWQPPGANNRTIRSLFSPGCGKPQASYPPASNLMASPSLDKGPVESAARTAHSFWHPEFLLACPAFLALDFDLVVTQPGPVGEPKAQD